MLAVAAARQIAGGGGGEMLSLSSLGGGGRCRCLCLSDAWGSLRRTRGAPQLVAAQLVEAAWSGMLGMPSSKGTGLAIVTEAASTFRFARIFFPGDTSSIAPTLPAGCAAAADDDVIVVVVVLLVLVRRGGGCCCCGGVVGRYPCRWESTTICIDILEKLRIHDPYNTDCITGGTPRAVEQIKNILKQMHSTRDCEAAAAAAADAAAAAANGPQ
jgi:hypothetical protein